MTRRDFGGTLLLRPLAAALLTEAALAQRAAINLPFPKDTVWLNANENPDGPPAIAIEAMKQVLADSGRYHYQEYRDFYAAVARSEGMEAAQLLVGAGSSEVLQAAVHAFTAPDRPLVQVDPTFEAVAAVTTALGREVHRVPLTPSYAADVRRLAEQAHKVRAGLVYLCNPNNPTGSITSKEEIAWLVANLPAGAVALIDEAYIHFAVSPALESALTHVRQGANVVVTRSYSKIYGMAGLRAGAAYARPDLIERMSPFRNNVISIVAVRAVLAAIAAAPTVLAERKARYNRTRDELCAWLRSKGLGYIESHANFVMIDLKRDVRPLIPKMVAGGVAVGRPFPPLDRMMRVSIGTPAAMEKFRQVFWEVYSASDPASA